MGWISSRIVVSNMTASTCIWRIGIVTIVTASTIRGDTCMSAFQNIVIIVHGKSSRAPACLSRVTGGAIIRKT